MTDALTWATAPDDRRAVDDDTAVDGFLLWFRDHGGPRGSCFAGTWWPQQDICGFFAWYCAEAGIEEMDPDRFRWLLTMRVGVETTRCRITNAERFARLRAYLARLTSRKDMIKHTVWRIATHGEVAALGDTALAA